MSIVRFSCNTCKAINKFYISVYGTEVVGVSLFLCRTYGQHRAIRIAMNVVSFDYAFAVANNYALAVPYSLAGADLINSED